MFMLNYSISKSINGFVYSIDMLYIRGYLTCSSVSADKYFSSSCDSSRNYKGRCKYSWFQNLYMFDGVSVYVGLFDNFDKVTRTWSIVPMAEIRFNPNKCTSEREKAIVDYFCSITDSRYLTKYDFSCDVPVPPSNVIVSSNRKRSYINDGETRYYGAFGGDKHIKVYDKQKESELESSLTRIEVTLKPRDTFVNETFYVINESSFDIDSLDGSTDTDKAIITMYLRLKAYEPHITIDSLNLGRKKEKKIKDLLLSSSLRPIPFSSDICSELLGLVSSRYDCTLTAINKQLLTESAYPEVFNDNPFV